MAHGLPGYLLKHGTAIDRLQLKQVPNKQDIPSTKPVMSTKQFFQSQVHVILMISVCMILLPITTGTQKIIRVNECTENLQSHGSSTTSCTIHRTNTRGKTTSTLCCFCLCPSGMKPLYSKKTRLHKNHSIISCLPLTIALLIMQGCRQC